MQTDGQTDRHRDTCMLSLTLISGHLLITCLDSLTEVSSDGKLTLPVPSDMSTVSCWLWVETRPLKKPALTLLLFLMEFRRHIDCDTSSPPACWDAVA